jgi:DNA-binding beta-propeller fold protein YncE
MAVVVGAEGDFGWDGAEIDATWTFGDGRVGEATRVTTHHYDAPGHYVATLTVRDAQGREDRDSRLVTVHWPILAEPPRSSGTLAVGSDRAFAVLPDWDAVAVVDRVGHAVSHVEVCHGPRALSLGRSSLAIGCEDDAVAVVALADLSVRVLPMPRGSAPAGVVWSADEGRLSVALPGLGEVRTLDAGTAEVLSGEPLPDAWGLAQVGDVILATSLRGGRAAGLVLAPDPGPDSDTTSRGVPMWLRQIVPSPDGRRVALPGSQSNIFRGLIRDGQPLTQETTVRSALRLLDLQALDEDIAARKVFDDRDLAAAAAWSPLGDWIYVAQEGMAVVDVLDAATTDLVGTLPVDGDGVDGVAVDETGGVWILASLSRRLIAPDGTPIDLRPGGVEIVDPVLLRGQQLFTAAKDPRVTRDGYLSCASCHLHGMSDGLTWDFSDRGEGLRNTIDLRGHRGAGHGPIHWTANFDEVQDFENDIRGPMAGAGFLSEEDWVLCRDTLGPEKAGRSEDLDALAAWVSSLDTFPRSPFREADGSMTALAIAGEAIAADPAVGCLACHPGPEFTDSAWIAPGEPRLHDVGTFGPGSGQRRHDLLTGLDTPTLRGLWATGPYLHDGGAATVLDAVLPRYPGRPADQHGVVSDLDVDELAALERYLMELE